MSLSKNLLETLRPRNLFSLGFNQRGQGMTEYVIILVAIAVVCIAITVQFGDKVNTLFETASDELDEVGVP